MTHAECGLRNAGLRPTRVTNSALRTPHSARRGSFSLEHATLIVIVAAAMIGMAIYVKRALSGRWRSVGDTFGSGRQYEGSK